MRGNQNFVNQSLNLCASIIKKVFSQLVSYHNDETDITCFRLGEDEL